MTQQTSTRLVWPASSAAGDGFDCVITPDSAGWGYSSLRILSLPAGGSRRFASTGEEILLLPLSGAATIEVSGSKVNLNGRPHVFAGPTDFAYLPVGTEVAIESAAGGRFALAGARTDRVLPFRYGSAGDVPREVRGAGRSSRIVRNFATPDAFEAAAIIACEVITPGGNWSSYPAHKHDHASERESVLEEIYYFEIAPGPDGEPGFGFHRTTSSEAGEIDVLAEIHDQDVALVPYGWHGPCVAAPGFDMYYLNVMAGPGERVWKITDHPAQAWIRDTWASEEIDPRLTFATRKGA